VLLAYSKMWLYDEVLSSPLPDDPWVATALERYFPQQLRTRFAGYMPRHPLRREIIATHVINSMLNRVGSTFVHRLAETTGARPFEIVRAYLISREIFGIVSLWSAIEALDNMVADAVQSHMLIDLSRQLERGTKWFLRSKRLNEDMAATIAHFTPGVEAVRARLPVLLEEGERARVDEAIGRYVSQGVPKELAERVVNFSALFSTLDIAEVAANARQPVEPVAAIYFDVTARLGIAWLRERIAALPGDQHWQMLAKGAMLDDLSSLQRAITSAALAAGAARPAEPAALVSAWATDNARALERAAQLMAELRAAPAADAAMLSVALRELRALG
jgi:glutamate dehydrogenase